MFDYLDKFVPKNDDYDIYAEHFGQDGCSTKWQWILGACIKNIFSLDQVPLWDRPFCRIFTFWFISFHGHVKAFMAGNGRSGGKSLFYVILSKPWQPQPIHLQNGICLEKMLKTFENINSLQNGYLFWDRTYPSKPSKKTKTSTNWLFVSYKMVGCGTHEWSFP